MATTGSVNWRGESVYLGGDLRLRFDAMNVTLHLLHDRIDLVRRPEGERQVMYRSCEIFDACYADTLPTYGPACRGELQGWHLDALAAADHPRPWHAIMPDGLRP